ncbi:response regulator [uncultured Pseudodesulfovibrio sp.]|uniref:response regulator n=1 Tax=uncultured Pseudodesulfovibrio sp. TaxID=2035858 RepID=UPI0029C842D7|nr:response regulator [uncultured Pseudodesulfovibrio sp.]
MQNFGDIVRTTREKLLETNKAYSLRQVSKRIGVGPSYLSKIERGEAVRLSEEKIIALAQELNLNPDYLLALGGKISDDVQKIIKKRPELFAKIVRGMQDMADEIIEEENDLKAMTASLNRLHAIASIGAFHFAEEEGLSFWTSQVPAILGLKPDTPPSIEAILNVLPPSRELRPEKETPTPDESGKLYEYDFKLHEEGKPTKIIRMWGCVDQNETTGGKTYLGMIQDVTEGVHLRNEIDSAKRLLEIQVDEQESEISAAITRLHHEIESRKKLETNLQQLNRKISDHAQNQEIFFKEHAYQLRSLISRMVLQLGTHVTDKPDELQNLLNRILPKIDDLGDFLSHSEGLSTTQERVDIHEVLKDTIAAFEKEAGNNGLTITHSLNPRLPRIISADERRIRQILISTMELFVRNTQWGTIHFSSTTDETAHQLIITFFAPSVTTPINRAMFFPDKPEAHQRPEYTNSIRMVGPLITLLGGEFTIASPAGTDLSITLRFPIAPVTTKETEPNASPSAKSNEAINVLIVEDDPYNLLYVRNVMEGAGFTVEEALSGEEALNRIRMEKFDLLLLDIQLPDIDGTEIANTIRNETDMVNHTIPIIAVTAHGSPSDRQKFISSGIDEVITKPFEKDKLLLKVKNVTTES